MINMQRDLIINVQTLVDIQSWQIGEQFLNSLFSIEKLRPQKVANFGEVTAKHGQGVEVLEDCQPFWAPEASVRSDGSLSVFFQDFNWRRNKVCKSIGVVDFPTINRNGKKIQGGILFESEFKKEIDWISLFKNWCLIISSRGGILHPAISYDCKKIKKRDANEMTFDEEIEQIAWSRFSTGTFYCEFRAGELNSLVSGLTNLGWASWFGLDLAKEVDEKTIYSAGFPIRKINDGYLIQVTENINDVFIDYKAFSRKRAELKSLFRKDLFLIKEEPIIA